MAVALQAEGRPLSARLRPECDPEGGKPRNEPSDAHPNASLAKPAMKANAFLGQPQRQSGEPDSVVVLQGE
jgi:hypothetical protein